MLIDPSAPGWYAREAALVAEFSEAHAYVALARVARGYEGAPPVATAPLAGGVALSCQVDRKTTLFNRVIGLGLHEPISAATLAKVATHFAHGNAPWGLELAPAGSSEGVQVLLKQVRLRRGLPTAMLAIDCRELRAERPAWRIERGGLEAGTTAADMVSRVFGVSRPVCAVLSHAPRSPQFAQWLAFDGVLPVASCLMHVHGETAWFGWSATLPTYRRRGLQSALLWHCLRHAEREGCRWLTAETAIGTAESPDASYRNMLRFGFVELYRRHGYLCMPRVAASAAKSPA